MTLGRASNNAGGPNVIRWLLGLCALLASLVLPNAMRAQTPFILSVDDAEPLIIDGVRIVQAENGDLVLLTRHHGQPGTFRNGFGFTRLTSEGVPTFHNVITQLDSVLESWLYDVIELSDGSFALVGRYDFQAMYMRLSATGAFMGAWTYPGTSGISTATCVRSNGDSSLVIGGWAHGNGPAYYDARLLQVHWNGGVLQAEGRQFDERSSFIHCAVAAQDGGMYFAGGCADTIPDGTSSDKDLLLFRTDDDGAEVWSRRILCGGVMTTAQWIEQLPSGDLMAGGTHHIATGGVAYPFLMKFNEAGYPLWAKFYALPSGTSFGDATFISDDRLAMTAIDPELNMILMVLDTQGLVLSAQNIQADEFAQSLVATTDGGLAIGSYDFPYDVGMDLGLAKLDQTMEWTCPAMDLVITVDSIPFETAGPDSILPLSVIPLDRTSLFADSSFMINTYVPCVSQSVPPDAEARIASPPFTIANEWLTIDPSVWERMELLDASGHVIAARSRRNDIFQMDLRTLPAGFYLVRVFNGVDQLTGKFVKP